MRDAEVHGERARQQFALANFEPQRMKLGDFVRGLGGCGHVGSPGEALQQRDGAQMGEASTVPLTLARGFAKNWIGPEGSLDSCVGADLNLTHRADPILTRGWKPTA